MKILVVIFTTLIVFLSGIKAQDVRILRLRYKTNVIINDYRSDSKTYTITRDSLVATNTIGDEIFVKKSLLSNEYPFFKELLETFTGKWEDIEYTGKSCVTCDTSYGIGVTLQIANTYRSYWIRDIGAGYPSGMRETTDKLFALFKKNN